MVRLPLALLAGVVLVFLDAGRGVVNRAGKDASAAWASSGDHMGPSTPGPHRRPPPARQPRSTGVAAIHPKAGAFAKTSAAFTEADVRAYISAQPFGGKISSAGTSTIAKVAFMTDLQAAAILHANPGLDDDELVCVVEVTGSLSISGPPSTAGGDSPQAATMYCVFDAHSGNLLLQATRERPQERHGRHTG